MEDQTTIVLEPSQAPVHTGCEVWLTTIADLDDYTRPQACRGYTLAQAQDLFSPGHPWTSLLLVKGTPHATRPTNGSLRSIEAIYAIEVDFLTVPPHLPGEFFGPISSSFQPLTTPADIRAALPYRGIASRHFSDDDFKLTRPHTRAVFFLERPHTRDEVFELVDALDARLANPAVYVNPCPCSSPVLAGRGMFCKRALAAGEEWFERLDGPLLSWDLFKPSASASIQLSSTAVVSPTAMILAAASSGPSTAGAVVQSTLIPIVLTTEEHIGVATAVLALANDEEIFQRAHQLVRTLREPKGVAPSCFPPGMASIVPLPLAQLQTRLTAVAACGVLDEDGNLIPRHPPGWLVNGVFKRHDYPDIRPLDSIVETPILRADGSVLDAEGYDASSRLLFTPTISFPAIPSSPTYAEAERARDILLDLVCDFPFDTAAHKSAWLAALLSGFARFAYFGPTPLFLIDANTRGSGKSKLCDVIGTLTCGHAMALMPMADTDEEVRKQITTHMMAGTRLVQIDNIDGAKSLGCASLDAVLTRDRWQDRLLGVNQRVDMPAIAIWFATGNNVNLTGDIGRRTIHIRLNTPEERPESRSGFKHHDLLAYVRANRGDLVCAALTILRAYVVAGRPTKRIPSYGSFEGWSDLLRQVIVWLALPDPIDTREALMSANDSDVIALGELIEGLDEYIAHGANNQPVTTGQIAKDLSEDFGKRYERLKQAIANFIPGPSSAQINVARLGRKMSQFKGRYINGKCLATATVKNHALTWYVQKKVDQTTTRDVASVVAAARASGREDHQDSVIQKPDFSAGV